MYNVIEDTFSKLFESKGNVQISGIAISGDMAALPYVVWDNEWQKYEEKELIISISEIDALIKLKQTQVIDGEESS